MNKSPFDLNFASILEAEDYLLGTDVSDNSQSGDGSLANFLIGKFLTADTSLTMTIEDVAQDDYIVVLDSSDTEFSSVGRFKILPVPNGALDFTWHDVSYGSGWESYANGYFHPTYSKLGRQTRLRGNIRRASGTGTKMFTLPVGYRPPLKVRLPVLTDTGPGVIQVATDGDVKWVSGGTGWIVLDGLTFSITES